MRWTVSVVVAGWLLAGALLADTDRRLHDLRARYAALAEQVTALEAEAAREDALERERRALVLAEWVATPGEGHWPTEVFYRYLQWLMEDGLRDLGLGERSDVLWESPLCDLRGRSSRALVPCPVCGRHRVERPAGRESHGFAFSAASTARLVSFLAALERLHLRVTALRLSAGGSLGYLLRIRVEYLPVPGIQRRDWPPCAPPGPGRTSSGSSRPGPGDVGGVR